MEKSTGTIKSIITGGAEGIIIEDGSLAELDFINPKIPRVSVGERFAFLRIIQSTPQGDKVVIILMNKLPV